MSLKLNKPQIDALSRRILDEIISPISKINSDIINSDEYKNFYKTDPDCITLTALYKKYGYEAYYLNSILGTIRNKAFKDKFVNIPNIELESIMDEITIQTIDCNDINALIASVTEKFRK